MEDRRPHNLRQVLRRCEPIPDAVFTNRRQRGEFIVLGCKTETGGAFMVSTPTSQTDGVLWFKLEDEDLLDAVLKLAGGFIGDEFVTGQHGRRHNIETRHEISLEEYERRLANGTKACSVCRQWLPFIEFHTHRGRTLGLAAPCRECARKNENERRERKGLPARKQSGRQRHPHRRGNQYGSFEHAPVAESVLVDRFADGLGVLLKRHGATTQPEGTRWRIRFADKVRHLETADECGIYRFDDGTAMMVDRRDRHLVASPINKREPND